MASLLPDVPTRGLLLGMWGAWLVFALYVFGLPWLSKFFHDDLGYWEALCFTPAEEIQCGDGSDYVKLAKELGRKRDGKYYGCSCGEGVFGDWVCPVINTDQEVKYTAGYFSISYYITTASATGFLAGSTFIPLMAMWVYGLWQHGDARQAGTSDTELNQANKRTEQFHVSFKFVFGTQVVFQVLYGLFLFFTICVSPREHGVVVTSFIVVEVLHFLAVAWLMHSEGLRARVIQTLVLVAVVVLVAGFATVAAGPGIVPAPVVAYAFWFAECVGFAVILVLPPLIWSLTPSQLPSEPLGYKSEDI
eukprot:TRINITY_DN101553_c0_g1_i1.p1 TRINITY_DN101553_c0_g1~~TRINITY_DN101553_c0_g1_i1.p1  ORF type:complete len:305 (+),score=43.77 TRINITY_DN101553_c0_g1_i1:97-1011(+)